MPRDKWEKRKMTMDRSCRIATFKGQDPGKRTRKKKKKNGQEEEGKSVTNVTKAKQQSISKNESNWENQMPQRGQNHGKSGNYSLDWVI